MTFSKAFKEALNALPDKEKDKLLYRLLKKDPILAKRLEFELVSAQSVDDKRAEMEDQIKERVQEFSEGFYSLGYLNMDIRFLSGEITEYVKITKDKFGEASLNLLLLKEVLKHNKHRLANAKWSMKFKKLAVALLARIFKILTLIQKLDQDYFIEFEDNLQETGELLGDIPNLMKMAIHCGLDVNWFIQGHIPENIAEIYKHVRAEGYLSARHY
jgi:hypothetical protein